MKGRIIGAKMNEKNLDMLNLRIVRVIVEIQKIGKGIKFYRWIVVTKMKTTVNLYLRHEALNDDIAEQEHTIQNKYEEELEVSQVEIKFVVLSYWRRNSLITALYFPGFFAQDTKNLQRYDDQLFLGDLGEGWSWPCLAFGYLYMDQIEEGTDSDWKWTDSWDVDYSLYDDENVSRNE